MVGFIIIRSGVFLFFFQGVGVGENVVKLKYTTATAVKEKEGKFTCHSEVLCEGKAMQYRAKLSVLHS